MDNKVKEAPVLLIMFNRYDETKMVFDKLREAKVKTLYFVCDGPREGNVKDIEEQKKLKQLPEMVDWDCDVHIMFREKNMGCGRGVSSAITWAFENEDRLIILEDDCVPSLPWFAFCNHCLEKYKNDTRVWTINGRSQNENDPSFHGYDYTFTIYTHSAGWATWKRVWDGFDIKIPYMEQFMKEGGFSNISGSRLEQKTLEKLFVAPFRKNPNLYLSSWATPFDFYFLSNGGLAITPRENLIKLYGMVGTHSSGVSNTFVYDIRASESFTFDKEPLFVIPNVDYNKAHLNGHILRMKREKYSFGHFLKKIKSLLNG
jgi:hypothetical protein